MKIEGRGLDEELKNWKWKEDGDRGGREEGVRRREKGKSDKRSKASWQGDYRIAMKVGKSR